MTETPKCPYCGAELEVTHAFVNDATAAHKLVYTCFCRECGVYTPKRSTPEEALSAALHRAEPEMRPLTLEEAGESEDPVWLEAMGKVCIAQINLSPGENLVEYKTIGRGYAEYLYFGDYGKLWRCWPRKPTPEQMAAEWEEEEKDG